MSAFSYNMGEGGGTSACQSIFSRVKDLYSIFHIWNALSYRIKFADQTDFKGNIKTFILPLENKYISTTVF